MYRAKDSAALARVIPLVRVRLLAVLIPMLALVPPVVGGGFLALPHFLDQRLGLGVALQVVQLWILADVQPELVSNRIDQRQRSGFIERVTASRTPSMSSM